MPIEPDPAVPPDPNARSAMPRKPEALTSPACLAAEMDDVYMGYAGRDELLAGLNELLEAECSGARKLRALVPRVRDPGIQSDLMDMIGLHEDYIRRLEALLAALPERA